MATQLVETTDDMTTTKTVTEQALTWPDRALGIVIDSHDACVRASELLLDIKALRKEVDAAFDPIIAKQHEAHKEACGQKKRAETPLVEAETILKRGLVAYQTQQERARRDEELRLQDLARRNEEALRAREAAALETEANATGDESKRAEAAHLINEPVATPAVYVPAAQPIAGISYRENWRADPNIDLKTLCAAIGRGEVPTTYVLPNMAALNGTARAQKGQMRIPGVKPLHEKIASAGSR